MIKIVRKSETKDKFEWQKWVDREAVRAIIEESSDGGKLVGPRKYNSKLGSGFDAANVSDKGVCLGCGYEQNIPLSVWRRSDNGNGRRNRGGRKVVVSCPTCGKELTRSANGTRTHWRESLRIFQEKEKKEKEKSRSVC